jgi:putative tryptophan/tyrosine transport system substrate-binding protein
VNALVRTALWLFVAACSFGASAMAAAPVHRVLHVADYPPSLAQEERAELLRSFAALGYEQGRNLDLVTRDVSTVRDSSYADLFARESGRLGAELVLASGIRAAEAAKASNVALPIVFWRLTDPVGFGLVDSLARPGGRLTGFSRAIEKLTGKRLELLHEMLPRAERFGFVFIEDLPSHRRQAADVRATAAALGLNVREYALPSSRWIPGELDTLFAGMQRDRIDAFLLPDINVEPRTLIELAARYRLPTIHSLTHVVTDWGGLAAYSTEATSTSDVVEYAVRILKGERPADLPVQEPTRFEFVLNARAARALGIAFPASFLMRASEVIEK